MGIDFRGMTQAEKEGVVSEYVKIQKAEKQTQQAEAITNFMSAYQNLFDNGIWVKIGSNILTPSTEHPFEFLY